MVCGVGSCADESTSTSASTATSEAPVPAVDAAPAAAADSETEPAPAEAAAPAAAPATAPSSAAIADEAPVEDFVEGRDVEAIDSGARDALGWEAPQALPGEENEAEVVPTTTAVVEEYTQPEDGGAGSVEPPADPNQGVDGYGHATVDSELNGVAILMAGKHFRWLQGSKDVAKGFYGIPVLLSVWSCKDKNFNGFAKWLTGLESKYSDHMVSVLQPANESERSLTSGDNVCGLSSRPLRSHGVDLDGSVVKKLGAKRSPAVYVYNELGEVVASHVGPLKAGSAGAKKIEAAFRPLMAPILQLRRTSAKP